MLYIQFIFLLQKDDFNRKYLLVKNDAGVTMNIKGKEILNFSVSAEIEGKTSYFDLDKRELPDDVKCTLYSLCKEISAGSTQTKGVMIEDLIKITK